MHLSARQWFFRWTGTLLRARVRTIAAEPGRRPFLGRIGVRRQVLLAVASCLAAGGAVAQQSDVPCAGRTGHNLTVIFPAALPAVPADVAIAPGDTLMAVSESVPCAGFLVWPSARARTITVWGDDPMTPERDGLTPGEPFRFSVIDATSNVRSDVTVGSTRPLTYERDAVILATILSLTPTATDTRAETMPLRTTLHGNHPNPFARRTTISYELARAAHVILDVYDTAGRRVAVLVDQWQSVGTYDLPLTAAELGGSGVYFVRLVAGEQQSVWQMVVVR